MLRTLLLFRPVCEDTKNSKQCELHESYTSTAFLNLCDDLSTYLRGNFTTCSKISITVLRLYTSSLHIFQLKHIPISPNIDRTPPTTQNPQCTIASTSSESIHFSPTRCSASRSDSPPPVSPPHSASLRLSSPPSRNGERRY